MNKLLPALIFVAHFSSAQTNVYHPFPESNAVWNYNMFMVCSFGASSEDFYSITYGSDTVIGPYTYHSLETPYLIHTQQGNCVSAQTAHGRIRQDTALRKVFILHLDSIEQLLYDFNLEVGDTVWGYTMGLYPDVVQSIDSVLVGNDYRKRWLINPYYLIYWIEGIGSTYGLINVSPGNISDQPVYDLTCFWQNGQTLYPDTSSSCEIIDAIADTDNEHSRLAISPNPFQTNTTLSMNGNKAENNLLLKICNSLGVVVRTEMIPSFPFVLEKKSLSNGIHFYTVQNQDMTIVGNGKFILY